MKTYQLYYIILLFQLYLSFSFKLFFNNFDNNFHKFLIKSYKLDNSKLKIDFLDEFRIYNTISRQKEKFQAIDPPNV